jgi:hypothetical protein
MALLKEWQRCRLLKQVEVQAESICSFEGKECSLTLSVYKAKGQEKDAKNNRTEEAADLAAKARGSTYIYDDLWSGADHRWHRTIGSRNRRCW